ncbi:MAG: hypothetical protein M1828_004255 [Chrysothrix sp. TS-e1954]|nr:MAG: hypothetical protein M1828_004255 [Chrysothrix sp. TS-e1954]
MSGTTTTTSMSTTADLLTSVHTAQLLLFADVNNVPRPDVPWLQSWLREAYQHASFPTLVTPYWFQLESTQWILMLNPGPTAAHSHPASTTSHDQSIALPSTTLAPHNCSVGHQLLSQNSYFQSSIFTAGQSAAYSPSQPSLAIPGNEISQTRSAELTSAIVAGAQTALAEHTGSDSPTSSNVVDNEQNVRNTSNQSSSPLKIIVTPPETPIVEEESHTKSTKVTSIDISKPPQGSSETMYPRKQDADWCLPVPLDSVTGKPVSQPLEHSELAIQTDTTGADKQFDSTRTHPPSFKSASDVANSAQSQTEQSAGTPMESTDDKSTDQQVDGPLDEQADQVLDEQVDELSDDSTTELGDESAVDATDEVVDDTSVWNAACLPNPFMRDQGNTEPPVWSAACLPHPFVRNMGNSEQKATFESGSQTESTVLQPSQTDDAPAVDSRSDITKDQCSPETIVAKDVANDIDEVDKDVASFAQENHDDAASDASVDIKIDQDFIDNDMKDLDRKDLSDQQEVSEDLPAVDDSVTATHGDLALDNDVTKEDAGRFNAIANTLNDISQWAAGHKDEESTKADHASGSASNPVAITDGISDDGTPVVPSSPKKFVSKVKNSDTTELPTKSTTANGVVIPVISNYLSPEELSKLVANDEPVTPAATEGSQTLASINKPTQQESFVNSFDVWQKDESAAAPWSKEFAAVAKDHQTSRASVTSTTDNSGDDRDDNEPSLQDRSPSTGNQESTNEITPEAPQIGSNGDATKHSSSQKTMSTVEYAPTSDVPTAEQWSQEFARLGDIEIANRQNELNTTVAQEEIPSPTSYVPVSQIPTAEQWTQEFTRLGDIEIARRQASLETTNDQGMGSNDHGPSQSSTKPKQTSKQRNAQRKASKKQKQTDKVAEDSNAQEAQKTDTSTEIPTVATPATPIEPAAGQDLQQHDTPAPPRASQEQTADVGLRTSTSATKSTAPLDAAKTVEASPKTPKTEAALTLPTPPPSDKQATSEGMSNVGDAVMSTPVVRNAASTSSSPPSSSSFDIFNGCPNSKNNKREKQAKTVSVLRYGTVSDSLKMAKNVTETKTSELAGSKVEHPTPSKTPTDATTSPEQSTPDETPSKKPVVKVELPSQKAALPKPMLMSFAQAAGGSTPKPSPKSTSSLAPNKVSASVTPKIQFGEASHAEVPQQTPRGAQSDEKTVKDPPYIVDTDAERANYNTGLDSKTDIVKRDNTWNTVANGKPRSRSLTPPSKGTEAKETSQGNDTTKSKVNIQKAGTSKQAEPRKADKQIEPEKSSAATSETKTQPVGPIDLAQVNDKLNDNTATKSEAETKVPNKNQRKRLVKKNRKAEQNTAQEAEEEALINAQVVNDQIINGHVDAEEDKPVEHLKDTETNDTSSPGDSTPTDYTSNNPTTVPTTSATAPPPPKDTTTPPILQTHTTTPTPGIGDNSTNKKQSRKAKKAAEVAHKAAVLADAYGTVQ